MEAIASNLFTLRLQCIKCFGWKHLKHVCNILLKIKWMIIQMFMSFCYFSINSDSGQCVWLYRQVCFTIENGKNSKTVSLIHVLFIFRNTRFLMPNSKTCSHQCEGGILEFTFTCFLLTSTTQNHDRNLLKCFTWFNKMILRPTV